MAIKAVYWVVAATGIAAASATAWWQQSRPVAPREIVANGNGGTGSGNGAASATAALAGVEVAAVQTTRLQDDVQAVGTLRSRQSVVLRPEVAGRVVALGFADGARVRRGQVLVQLDDSLQRAELSQAQAQVSVARANHQRNQELVARQFVAQRVLDESAASLQVAEAQLALAQARLARMRISAPFDGTLGIRGVNLGDFVKDGADLVNLEDLSTMYVDFRLPERDQAKLRRGQAVELQLDALPGRRFVARVEAIDPLLDANGRSVAVRAVLPNSAGQVLDPAEPATRNASNAGGAGGAGNGGAGQPLRPGMFARATVVFGSRDAALVVPEEAVVPQGGRQYVFLVQPPRGAAPASASGGAAEGAPVSQRQEVRLGLRRQGLVEVTEGLRAGQTVVLAGQQRLQQDGTPLRVLGPAAPASAPASAPVR